jgi:23S rRNA pseudouridine1911/1915/1917 synthase
MTTTINVPAEAAGERLDAYLAGQLTTTSRSRLQKLIKSGVITLNGKKVTPHIALSERDAVAYPDEAAVPPTVEVLPNPSVKFEIIHEDRDVFVVSKPTGVLVHPAAGETDTLMNGLLAKYPALTKVGEGADRPGIVHRLDKDASGLLVVAKTKKAYESLKKQFQGHTVLKEYTVLVAGATPHDEGTIEMHIGRASFGGKMAARDKSQAREDDREAITHYYVEEELSGASLLRVRTETGRTHQIRVHLNALGCPVAGDPLYGTKNKMRLASPRLFLHCRRLAFDHPTTGARMEFEAPLPADLQEYLEKVRKLKS